MPAVDVGSPKVLALRSGGTMDYYQINFSHKFCKKTSKNLFRLNFYINFGVHMINNSLIKWVHP